MPGSDLRIFALILGPFRLHFDCTRTCPRTACGTLYHRPVRLVPSPAVLGGTRMPVHPTGRLCRVNLRSLWQAHPLPCGRAPGRLPLPSCHFWWLQIVTTIVCLSFYTRVRGSLGRYPALGHLGHGACAHPQPHGQHQAVLGGSVAAHAPPRAGRPVTPRSHQP